MTFQFSRHQLQGLDKRLERLLEILPGTTSWTILLGMLALSFWKPRLAAVLVIAFDLYWLLRLFYMTLFLILSYLRLTLEQETDWMTRTTAVEGLVGGLQTPQQLGSALGVKQRISTWISQRELRAVMRSGGQPPRLEQIHHVVIMPIAKESREVYEPGIQSLIRQQWPSRQMLIVLAVEERAGQEIKDAAREIQARYRSQFLDFLVTVHPDGLPGEARVKGANVTYAARAVAASLQHRGIPFEHVVVSCFDADTIVSPAYFSCLTNRFMLCPQRLRASFQPIPVYHNNIWNVPGFARVLDVGSSFFQLVEATNPEKLVTFSSHSMSFKALVDIGYWPVDMISDDSAIFWKAFLHYEGDYRVVPMYVTVSMDVAASDSWRKTVVNVYRQKRRWAWGVENFPIVMRGFLHSRNISLGLKIKHAFKLLEGHIAWATWPFLLGVIGWIPAWFAGREFSNTIVYYTAPRIAIAIFQLSSIGLVTTVILSLCLLPRPLVKRPWLKKVGHMFEWLLVPVIAIGLSAIPALDAQTRLMLGNYLDFWVTEKKR